MPWMLLWMFMNLFLKNLKVIQYVTKCLISSYEISVANCTKRHRIIGLQPLQRLFTKDYCMKGCDEVEWLKQIKNRLKSNAISKLSCYSFGHFNVSTYVSLTSKLLKSSPYRLVSKCLEMKDTTRPCNTSSSSLESISSRLYSGMISCCQRLIL